MSAREPAVLVMAEAPLPGGGAGGLETLLGARGASRLQAVLLARAGAWGLRVAPGAAHLAFWPATRQAERAVKRAAPAGLSLLARTEVHAPARVAGAVGDVLESQPGPLIVVGTRLPWLGDYHAQATLSDLREGCDTVLGVAIRGGLYLLAVREPVTRLLELFDERHDGEQTRRLSREAAAELDLSVGMLHYERTLDTPSDARAMLADPLLPAEVAAALAPSR